MKERATIRMNPFEREPAALKRQVHAAAKRVLKSGYYILGPEVEAFEQEWSTYTRINHTVGVGNGLDALELGLRAIGIGRGDEVITTAMTAFATVLAIHRAGATPIIADIDPGTALLSIDSASSLVTERTKAVIFVHLYGRAGNMPEWQTFSNQHGLHLIEDCAQAHGARIGGRHVGSFGIFGAFSFYPTKNLGGVGDGGAFVTGDAELAAKVRSLRNYGQKNRYEHSDWGMNSRLDEIQAATLRAKLTWLDRATARRRQVATLIRGGLKELEGISLLKEAASPEEDVHHLFVVRVREREKTMERLAERGIDSLIHYPVPSHKQHPLISSSPATHLPNAENFAQHCFSLPASPWMTWVEVRRLTATLRTVFEPARTPPTAR